MASEIRVDKITSLSGVGTISPSPTGVEIAGITTVGSLITSSAVGVGTTNPSAKLETFQEGTRSAGYLFMARAGLDVGRRGYGLYPPSTDSADAPFVWNTGNSHSFEVDNVDRLRIHHSGKIGIGTDNPAADLHISSGANTEIRIADTTTTPSYARIIYNNNADSADALVFEVDGGNDISDSNIRFRADGSEKLRITSDGRLLVNSTVARNIGAANNRMLQIESSGGGAGIAIARNQNTGSGPVIDLGKSRGYPHTIVQADDRLGQIDFAGADGTDLETVGASMVAEVDGTPGENDMPGRLVFKTTADGNNSPAERLRITNAGELLVNATTISGAGGAAPKMAIDVGDSNLHGLLIQAGGGESNGDLAGIAFSQGNTGDIARPKAAIAFNRAASYGRGDLCFYVDNAGDGNPVSSGDEKLRISRAGGITFNGDTATANALDDYEEGTFTPTTNQGSFTSAEGKYTKIGNQVTVWIYIPTISNTTSTDFFNVQSLPFSGDANMVQATGSVMIRYINAASPDGVNFSTYQDGGWSYLRIYACRDDGNNYEAVRHSDFTQTSPGLRICHTYQAA